MQYALIERNVGCDWLFAEHKTRNHAFSYSYRKIKNRWQGVCKSPILLDDYKYWKFIWADEIFPWKEKPPHNSINPRKDKFLEICKFPYYRSHTGYEVTSHLLFEDSISPSKSKKFKKLLIGKWRSTDAFIEFRKNGKYTVKSECDNHGFVKYFNTLRGDWYFSSLSVLFVRFNSGSGHNTMMMDISDTHLVFWNGIQRLFEKFERV